MGVRRQCRHRRHAWTKVIYSTSGTVIGSRQRVAFRRWRNADEALAALQKLLLRERAMIAALYVEPDG